MLLTPFFFACFILKTSANFASLTSLSRLANSEVKLKSILDSYIENEYRRLENLKVHSESLSETVEPKSKLWNPIAAFSLTSRLRKLLVFLRTNRKSEEEFMEEIDRLNLPKDDDLRDIAKMILELQTFYKLPAKKLAEGWILHTKTEEKLTAEDCFYIGETAIAESNFPEAKSWFETGLSISDSVNEEEIKYRIMLETVLSLVPKLTSNASEKPIDWSDFQELCRKNFTSVLTDLKCTYKSTNAFTILAPFKVEEKHLEPDVFVFHDVLSDREMAKLKKTSYKWFSTSLVSGYNAPYVESKYRISQDAGLSEQHGKFVSDIQKRVEDMTGLSGKYNLGLHVANYVFGGSYYPHHDNLLDGEQTIDILGNRIATVLFYLNDVKFGGSTIFLNLNISITPKKGSALFWYNTKKNGDLDTGGLHAGCPVLLGTKWIATQWIREFGQEFRRPCEKEDN